jgi:hypothetical protein
MLNGREKFIPRRRKRTLRHRRSLDKITSNQFSRQPTFSAVRSPVDERSSIKQSDNNILCFDRHAYEGALQYYCLLELDTDY